LERKRGCNPGEKSAPSVESAAFLLGFFITSNCPNSKAEKRHGFHGSPGLGRWQQDRSNFYSANWLRSACLTSGSGLRVRAKINSHFGASAGWADARRRDAGDVVTSSRSGNAANARRPPRPKGLQPLQHLNSYHQLSADSASERAAAKCEVIFARALSMLILLRDPARFLTVAVLKGICAVPRYSWIIGTKSQPVVIFQARKS
jgi:hypothetical protein